MIMVCILGPYTGPDVLTVAGNCRRGHDMAIELLRRGYCVHDPWLDLEWALRANLPLETFKNNTIEIMKRSDAIMLTEGWEFSEGVKPELEIARRRDIPVFLTPEELDEWVRIGHGDAKRSFL
jgi:hypothetical protein